MNGFAAWGLTILGLAVVMTVAEMLLPSGKLRKVIRSVFATVTVFVVVTPLPGLFKSGSFDFSGDGSVETDGSYLEYVEDAKKSIILRAAEEYFASKGYSDGYVLDIELGSDWEVKSVSVKFTNFGMTGNGEHINKSEFIELAADYFGVGKEAIMTYG